MRIITILAAMLLLTSAGLAQSPEVKKAYEAIPHRFTPFESSRTNMKTADKTYLRQNFELVNRAVSARVRTMQSRKYGQYTSEVKPILAALEAQKAPKQLATYHSLVIGAIKDQRSYFQAWSKSKSSAFNPQNPKVQSSSKKLRQAYSILMGKYPKEAKRVKQAFFDHLCALDFI